MSPSLGTESSNCGEHVRVVARIRPVEEETLCCRTVGERTLEMVTPPSCTEESIIWDGTDAVSVARKKGRQNTESKKQFTLDYTFGPECSQQAVYERSTAKSLVLSATRGYNATIFAYGNTGSGKSYTMMGTQSAPGITPRAVRHVFEAIKNEQKSNEVQFDISLSYVELYNNQFRNLLDGYGDTKRDPTKIEIRESKSNGIFLAGPSNLIVPVRTESQVRDCVSFAELTRATASTNCNDQSSRSHAILTLYIERHDFSSTKSLEVTGTAAGLKCQGKLNLVDLAGSERVSVSGATGGALIEAQNINLSLSLLGDVLAALSKRDQNRSNDDLGLIGTRITDQHSDTASCFSSSSTYIVPYRNSKLTYLLKDSLGGNSKTLMIATLRPEASYYRQSLVTLMYASRARMIRNRSIINVDTSVKKNMVDLSALRASYDRDRQVLDESNSELKRELEQSEARCSQLQSQLETTQTKSEQCHQQLTALNDSFGASKSEVRDMRRVLEAWQNQCLALQTKCQMLTTERKKLHTELNCDSDSFDALLGMLDKVKSKAQQTDALAAATAAAAASQAVAQSQRIIALQQELEMVESARQSLPPPTQESSNPRLTEALRLMEELAERHGEEIRGRKQDLERFIAIREDATGAAFAAGRALAGSSSVETMRKRLCTVRMRRAFTMWARCAAGEVRIAAAVRESLRSAARDTMLAVGTAQARWETQAAARAATSAMLMNEVREVAEAKDESRNAALAAVRSANEAQIGRLKKRVAEAETRAQAVEQDTDLRLERLAAQKDRDRDVLIEALRLEHQKPLCQDATTSASEDELGLILRRVDEFDFECRAFAQNACDQQRSRLEQTYNDTIRELTEQKDRDASRLLASALQRKDDEHRAQLRNHASLLNDRVFAADATACAALEAKNDLEARLQAREEEVDVMRLDFKVQLGNHLDAQQAATAAAEACLAQQRLEIEGHQAELIDRVTREKDQELSDAIESILLAKHQEQASLLESFQQQKSELEKQLCQQHERALSEALADQRRDHERDSLLLLAKKEEHLTELHERTLTEHESEMKADFAQQLESLRRRHSEEVANAVAMEQEVSLSRENELRQAHALQLEEVTKAGHTAVQSALERHRLELETALSEQAMRLREEATNEITRSLEELTIKHEEELAGQMDTHNNALTICEARFREDFKARLAIGLEEQAEAHHTKLLEFQVEERSRHLNELQEALAEQSKCLEQAHRDELTAAINVLKREHNVELEEVRRLTSELKERSIEEALSECTKEAEACYEKRLNIALAAANELHTADMAALQSKLGETQKETVQKAVAECRSSMERQQADLIEAALASHRQSHEAELSNERRRYREAHELHLKQVVAESTQLLRRQHEEQVLSVRNELTRTHMVAMDAAQAAFDASRERAVKSAIENCTTTLNVQHELSLETAISELRLAHTAELDAVNLASLNAHHESIQEAVQACTASLRAQYEQRCADTVAQIRESHEVQLEALKAQSIAATAREVDKVSSDCEVRLTRVYEERLNMSLTEIKKAHASELEHNREFFEEARAEAVELAVANCTAAIEAQHQDKLADALTRAADDMQQINAEEVRLAVAKAVAEREAELASRYQGDLDAALSQLADEMRQVEQDRLSEVRLQVTEDVVAELREEMIAQHQMQLEQALADQARKLKEADKRKLASEVSNVRDASFAKCTADYAVEYLHLLSRSSEKESALIETAVADAVASTRRAMRLEYESEGAKIRDQAIAECTASLTRKHQIQQSQALHDLKMSVSTNHAEDVKRIKAESRSAIEKAVADREIALTAAHERAMKAASHERRASSEDALNEKLKNLIKKNDTKWQAILAQRETELQADFDIRLKKCNAEARKTLDLTRAEIEAAHEAYLKGMDSEYRELSSKAVDEARALAKCEFEAAQEAIDALKADFAQERASWNIARENMNASYEEEVRRLSEEHRQECSIAVDEARMTTRIETEDRLSAQHARVLSEREAEFAAELRTTVESVLAERAAIYDTNTNEIRSGLSAKYQARITSIEAEKESLTKKLLHKDNHLELLQNLMKRQQEKFFATFDQIRQHIDETSPVPHQSTSADLPQNCGSLSPSDKAYSVDGIVKKIKERDGAYLKWMSNEIEKRDEQSTVALEATVRRANSRHLRRMTSAIKQRDSQWQALLTAAIQESDSKHSTNFHGILSQRPSAAPSVKNGVSSLKKETPVAKKNMKSSIASQKNSRSSRERHAFDDIANTSAAASEVQDFKLQLTRERQARWDAVSGAVKQPTSPTVTAHIDIGSRLVAAAVEGDSTCLETLLMDANLQSLESPAAHALGCSTQYTLLLHRAIAGFSFHADESRLMETLVILLRYGADINSLDSKGDSVLHKAVGISSPSTAVSVSEFLIKEHGADSEIPNGLGNTPLHTTLLHNAGDVTPAIVRILVSAGCNVHATNSDGQTPLELAQKLQGADHDYDRQQREQVLYYLHSAKKA